MSRDELSQCKEQKNSKTKTDKTGFLYECIAYKQLQNTVHMWMERILSAVMRMSLCRYILQALLNTCTYSVIANICPSLQCDLLQVYLNYSKLAIGTFFKLVIACVICSTIDSRCF